MVAPKALGKISELKKSTTVQDAIDPDKLYLKSKLYAQKVFECQQASKSEDAQLWAAVALELLGKAALSALHPSLVVDLKNGDKNPNILLEAAGISSKTNVKTIDASTTYARLKHIIPFFSTSVHDFAIDLANRRNTELHSGLSLMENRQDQEWSPRFWYASDLILSALGKDLKNWVGKGGKDLEKSVESWRKVKEEAAQGYVEEKRLAFDAFLTQRKRPSKNQENDEENGNLEVVKNVDEEDYQDCFFFQYDKYWKHECPACANQAVVAGDLAHEEETDEPDWRKEDNTFWQWYKITYYSEELYCPSCKLHVVETFALKAIEIEELYEEEEARKVDIDYDAYGND